MNKFIAVFRLIRVKQWIKNFFVVIPFILSMKFLQFNLADYCNLVIGYAAFCLISSAVYIFNDLQDLEEDRKHPTKKNRPIVSGEISTSFALILGIILAASSLILVYKFFNAAALMVIIAYLIKNLIYSFKVKHFAIFDVMFISLGFVFRVLFGALAFETPISKWIILLTFTLCLFLAFTKRRKDFITDGYLRKSLVGYNLVMLDKFIVISASLAIASYVMYTNEMYDITDNYGFIVSNLFVFFGIFRYLQAVHLDSLDTGESGIIIYKDLVFLANLVLWGCVLLFSLMYRY